MTEIHVNYQLKDISEGSKSFIKITSSAPSCFFFCFCFFFLKKSQNRVFCKYLPHEDMCTADDMVQLFPLPQSQC